MEKSGCNDGKASKLLPIERDKIYEVAAHVGKKKRVEEKVEGLSNLRDRKKVGY